ncbi:class I SAM-dependent DNA methyltransferase [Faecalibaculum rodentium]|jgi:SAM-dependent methyltransferase|uniref:Methyltransferase n=2 Tax=Faecalibaculum rodentium TaxID=1702221 RepID=A0A140DY78_9FIRM|nr:class I SAM-dependent methyltransferase [Faecalibaculum rodentium]AMK55605.1 methyltransferase [Faecalibaculum rodentium]
MNYDILARYYDALVKDDEATRHWVHWIGSAGSTLLDCACGSGEITRQLAEKYEDVQGMDLSPAMIEAAAAKDTDHKVTWSTGDMTDLSGFGTFDVITCLCDSVNYLDEAGFVRWLDQAWTHLNPGGYLYFDMHSQDRIEEFREGYAEAGTFEDGTQVQWLIESEDNVLYQDFAFYLPDGRTLQEHHLQYIHDPEFVRQELEKRFTLESVVTDFDLPGLQPGEKYFYICRKKETA